MDDPETGEPTWIDLSPWADRDPEATVIQVRWLWDSQEALEAVTEAGRSGRASAMAAVIRHLIADHGVPRAMVTRIPEAQHRGLHGGGPDHPLPAI